MIQKAESKGFGFQRKNLLRILKGVFYAEDIFKGPSVR